MGILISGYRLWAVLHRMLLFLSASDSSQAFTTINLNRLGKFDLVPKDGEGADRLQVPAGWRPKNASAD